MEIVIQYVHRGFPFTGKQLCTLAYEMATRDKKRGFSLVKMTAGRCWLRGFYKRHPEVRSKVSVNLLIARAISANPTQISHFFNQYKEWVDNWGLEYLPNNIWNINECEVADVPQPSTVVGVTGECSFQTMSGEKPTSTTIVSYISTGGMTMPPLVIFKAARIKPEWHKAAPTGYMIQGSASRYINAKLSQEYGEQFVCFVTEKKILTRDRKVFLLLDMHKSHLFNLGFMEFMSGHNVEVCCFPPHFTHVLQPLDDVPFALFKAEYQR